MFAMLAMVAMSAADSLETAYKRADELQALVRGKTLNVALAVNWIGNDALWYRAERTGGATEFMIATEKGDRRAFFDHSKLALSLGKTVGKELDGKKLPLTDLEPADDLSGMKFTYALKRYSVDFSSYKVVTTDTPAIPEATPQPSEESAMATEQALPLEGWNQARARQPNGESPDGTWSAQAREGSLEVKRKGGEWKPLSSEKGFSDFRWSPDSKYLVGWRLFPGDRKEVHLLASARPRQTRAVLQSRFYDQPGDVLDTYSPYIFDLESGSGRRVEVDPIMGGGQPWSSAPNVIWRDGKFVLSYPERGYQRFHVRQVDNTTGKVSDLVDESYPTFFDISSTILRFVPGSDEFVWRSERDGWGHLYLMDGSSGAMKKQLTSGNWVVRSVEQLNFADRTVSFLANGREPGDPYYQYLYRVDLDGTGLTLLTPERGTHRITWTGDRRSFIDTFSQVNVPPVHDWRRSDGSLIVRLESADISQLKSVGLRSPEPFVAKGRDGKTDIWGIVVRPSHYDRRKKYPVIENIYAGPHDSHVPKTYSPFLRMHRLAELGFVVVQIDGMGTRNRGKAFHDVCWQNIADAGFPDRILWMKALAEKDKSIDLNRVGIYGTSAGGQNAAAALLFHPEFYKVGVASCGCHDNRIDKMWWNEQWMGYPVGPHYAKNSSIENAEKLQGKLMLIVGELDRNVPPESTYRFADALQKAKKEYDLVVIPGADHTDGGDYGERKRRDFFVRHLLGKAPPEWNSGDSQPNAR